MIADEMTGERVSLPHFKFQETNAIALVKEQPLLYAADLFFSKDFPAGIISWFFFCTRHFFFFPIKHCLMFKNIETCSVSTIWSQNQHAPNSPITQLHPATTPAETDPFLSICPSCHWSWPWEVTSVTAPSSCDVASWQHPTRAICPETSSFSWLPSTP